MCGIRTPPALYGIMYQETTTAYPRNKSIVLKNYLLKIPTVSRNYYNNGLYHRRGSGIENQKGR
jgi:hypothetical protein